MTDNISTYLCNKKLPGISVKKTAVKASPQYESGSGGRRVVVRMVPTEHNPATWTVVASFFSLTNNVLDSICRKYGPPRLSWERTLIGLESNPRLSRYITVRANIPNLPCHWKQADVYTINLSPADHHLVFIARIDTAGGMIDGGKSGSNPLKSTDLAFMVTERTLVPGELLQLAWTLRIDDKSYTGPVMGSWYALPLITGGKVISKIDDDDTNAYVVRVQNVNLVCLATDWAGYQVGDWVFVLKPEYEGTLKPKAYSWEPDEYEPYIDDTKEYGSGNISQPGHGDTGYRIMPLNVDFFGNAHGDFEKIEMLTSTPEELDKAFKTTRHTGTISSVDHGTGTASVVLKDAVLAGSFDNVPIFYHCPDETTTEGGSVAFAEDDEVIVYNEGGGANPSPNDLCIVGFKSDLKKCGYIFHVVRDDGVIMDDEHIELEYNGIIASTIDYQFAPFTGIYDPETETWQGNFEFGPLVDTSGGLFVFFYASGFETLYTQYPYKYTNDAQWKPEDRIFPGRFEVAIPYWSTTPSVMADNGRVQVEAVLPGRYYSTNIQLNDLYELRDLVDASIELPPYFNIKYRNSDGSYLGISKPFFTNGGSEPYKRTIISSVPFKAKTNITTARAVPCPHTAYNSDPSLNPQSTYMPCGAYAYRPLAPANTEESCCEDGEYVVNPVSGWHKQVEEHGCFDVSRYDDSDVDDLIRQGKLQITCHDDSKIDVEAARVDDPANDGIRNTPETENPPTFEVTKNEEQPPFAMPTDATGLDFTGEILETTTFVTHDVCCQCYTYDGGTKVYTHHATPADYVATGKNLEITISFTPIQV